MKFTEQILIQLYPSLTIGLNKDGSIEYIKDYITQNNEFIKLAVRVTSKNQYFARSLYALNAKRVNDYIVKGALLPYSH